ncbi:MAG: sulfotransferase, partial [Deltaproteobacteria bacterium]|nr:sulfotransferase [Deltaproteobacteria bacterium]
MYVDFPTLADALRASIKSGKTSPRYWAWSLGFLDFYALMVSTVSAAQRLDDALYPEWKRTAVKEPVFIFAGARSGTTLLHRLLALDEQRFTSFKLYQTLMPSVSAYKAIDALTALDKKLLGGRFGKNLLALDQSLFPKFRDIHPMGLTEAEEEEALFIYTLVSPAMLLLFPFVDGVPRAWSMDHVPESAKNQVMDFYRGCIQRHLMAEGADR